MPQCSEVCLHFSMRWQLFFLFARAHRIFYGYTRCYFWKLLHNLGPWPCSKQKNEWLEEQPNGSDMPTILAIRDILRSFGDADYFGKGGIYMANRGIESKY